MQNIFSLIVLSFLIVSCEKQEDNLPPRDFEILHVGGHFHDKIFIRWSESTDPENSEITYDILISEKGNDYQIMEKSISRFDFNSNGIFIRPDSSQMYYIEKPSSEFVYSYSLINLEHNTKYTIKIVAKDQDGQKNEKLLEVSTKYLDLVAPLPFYFGTWNGEYTGLWRDIIWGGVQSITGNLTFKISKRLDLNTISFETNLKPNFSSTGSFNQETLSLTIFGYRYPAARGTQVLDSIIGNFKENSNRVEGIMKHNGVITGSWYATKE
jgi:hypothetical protein